MSEVKFDLSFNEAMQEVFGGHYVQGEWFAWNTYLVEEYGSVMVHTFEEEEAIKYKDHGALQISPAVLEQRYRTVDVLNRSGLYHK